MSGKIRVMVVDDSALMRKFISDILSEDPEIEVVATAPNGKIALDKLGWTQVDVLTLDVEMPVLNGIETLMQIMAHKPMPVVMISALTQAGAELTFQALELGAVDFITKPDATLSRQIMDLREEIRLKVKTAAGIRLKAIPQDVSKSIVKEEKKIAAAEPPRKMEVSRKVEHVVTIGISTGGPEALREILPTIPADINAAILIVQHMPPGFTKAFADRMNTLCKVEVMEAKEGDTVLPGRIFIAPGDYHMSIRQDSYSTTTHISQEPKVNLFRPSIDVLMKSTADKFGEKNICIMMTGMARDGVEGLKYSKQKGAFTIAQDEETSVVFGMNKLAIQTGCVDKILPLKSIVPQILHKLNLD